MNCSRRFIECDVTHRTNILELLPRVFFPLPKKRKSFYNLPPLFHRRQQQACNKTEQQRLARVLGKLELLGFEALRLRKFIPFPLSTCLGLAQAPTEIH